MKIFINEKIAWYGYMRLLHLLNSKSISLRKWFATRFHITGKNKFTNAVLTKGYIVI